MSYILEAIKKADRKRKLGEVPNLQTEHDDLDLQGVGKRPSWPYFLALILFFNAGILIWWLQPWQETPAPDKSIDKGANQSEEIVAAKTDLPGINGANTERGLEKKIAPNVVPENEVVKVADQNDGTTDKQHIPTILPETADGPKAAFVKESPPAIEAASSIAVGQVELQTIGKGMGSAPALGDNATRATGIGNRKEVVEQKKDTIASQPVNSEQTAKGKEEAALPGEEEELNDQLSDDSEIDTFGAGEESDDNGTAKPVIEVQVFDINKVPYIYQLPPSIKQKIPEIEISFHSYTFRPATRMVRVNGRILREGQSLTEEIKLKKIVPSGAVFVLGKKVFRVDV